MKTKMSGQVRGQLLDNMSLSLINIDWKHLLQEFETKCSLIFKNKGKMLLNHSP